MVLNASFSALVKLSVGLEELLIILTVSCLAFSAISTCRDCNAFSTPAKMSSIGIVLGVTASLSPFCSNEDTPSSSVWPLRLMTLSFEVFVIGFCVLWSRANFRSCLALLSSPTRVAFLNVSWSIRNQSDFESTLAKRKCIFSSSRDVLSSSRLF